MLEPLVIAASCHRLRLLRSITIAQWENEWISLSVLPVARVLIAQWENEWISLSVLPVAQVLIAQWENEWISLSVLPVAQVLMAQWENEWIPLSVLPWPGFNSQPWWSIFKGFLPGRSHSANPSWVSVTDNGSISPKWHHTTCAHRGGRLKSDHWQTMAERKNKLIAYWDSDWPPIWAERMSAASHSHEYFHFCPLENSPLQTPILNISVVLSL